jgi:hypothetical protein
MPQSEGQHVEGQHVEGQRIVETATEARGARPGRPVLYVLIASTLAVIALFTMAYLHFFT